MSLDVSSVRTRNYKGRKRTGILLAYVVLALLLLFALFPVFWMVLTSFKTDSQLRNVRDSPFWPNPWSLDGYGDLLSQQPVGQWLFNSLIVAVSSSTLAIVIGALGAFALTRMRFRGRAALGTMILFTYLVPPTVLFIPLFQMMKNLHLNNTLPSLILAYPTFTVPFVTWTLMTFFEGIPVELEEAAMIDGATRFQAFRRIVIPLALPGLVATGLFAFTQAWNEFLYALTFINEPSRQTIQVGISNIMVGDIFLWGQLMAAATLTTAPVVIIYMYLQRYNVAGLTAGSVKG